MAAFGFRILGPVDVMRDGAHVTVEAPKQRALLAALVLRANAVVPASSLVDYLWESQPPGTARNTLQTLVLRLRRLLEPGPIPYVLITRRPGYLLRVEPGQLDLHRFEELAAAGRRAAATGDVERAATALRDALALWRGSVAADAGDGPRRWAEVVRLEEERLDVIEERIAADLALGRHAEVVGELRELVAAHPFRERSWEELVLALYRAGRRGEALDAYRHAYRTLDRELGVAPGIALQRLHQQILERDPTLDTPSPPTAAARPPHPRQLPADVAEFTGREAYLCVLNTLVPDAGHAPTTATVVVIDGMAGVGKTALAVHWGHHVARRFPDGQLYLNLRGHALAPPMRPIEALAQLLRALGVEPKQVPIDPDEAAAMYRTLLAGRRVLVVLDNAATAEQVRPLLPGSPTCLVVVTSRHRLGGLVATAGARRITLDALTTDEALALLARTLGEQRICLEPEAAADLASLCGRLPLALRIAAAHIADQPDRGLADHVAHLSLGNPLAALAISDDAQVSVQAAFHLSYRTLPAKIRRTFRLLGQAPGPDFDHRAAAALADITPSEAQQHLGHLARAHLVEPRVGGRYTLHDLLRRYAQDRGEHEDSQVDLAIRRLDAWYLHAADAAARLLYPQMVRLPLTASDPFPVPFTGHDAALAWLDAERPSLVAITRRAATHGPASTAWQLADILRGYFWLRRHTVDWLAVARAGLAAARAGGEPRAQAAARLGLGLVRYSLGHHPSALRHYAAALALARTARWPDGQAAALGNLGIVYAEVGQLAKAASHHAEALAVNRSTGRQASQAANLNNLGAVYWEWGRLEQAADHYAQALEAHRLTGSRTGEALVLTNLGEVYHHLGRFSDACDHLVNAIRTCRGAGFRDGEADALDNLAAVCRDAGRLAEATEHARSALTLAREIGDRRTEAEALNTAATIQHRLGRYEAAVGQHELALRIARQIETRYPEIEALIGLAAAYRDLVQPLRAITAVHDALALARQAEYRVLEGRARTALGDIDLTMGHVPQAIEHARQALVVHRQTGYRLGEAFTHDLLGRALHQSECLSVAGPHWRAALQLFSDVGAPVPDHIHVMVDRNQAAIG